MTVPGAVLLIVLFACIGFAECRRRARLTAAERRQEDEEMRIETSTW